MIQRLQKQKEADATRMKAAEERTENLVTEIGQLKRGLAALESGMSQMNQHLSGLIAAEVSSVKLMLSDLVVSTKKAKGADSWNGPAWGHDAVGHGCCPLPRQRGGQLATALMRPAKTHQKNKGPPGAMAPKTPTRGIPIRPNTSVLAVTFFRS